ncbi:MAG: phospho-N-acetylmuramoyl-pentapeptide-transferase [Candidatus Omnitrophica bacterium]|nr:phospho-N-acetylmuramoyl-pentapeptide-transferase [Candidatus Omnitrophota bacterium]
MLYHLLYPLHQYFSFLNIFRYITFRAGMATITAFLISLIIGPLVIRTLQTLHIGEQITKGDSKQLDALHRNKHNTPTMGGVLILFAIIVSTLLWADIFDHYIIIVLLVTVWLGLTGLMDDYLKVVKKKSKGLTATAKLISQITLGVLLGLFLYWRIPGNTQLDVPFLKDITLEIGVWYILFVVLVLAGTSNAVNITDGLDGLAIGTVIMVSLAFSILTYVSGNVRFSQYLLIPYIHGAGELAVFCASILGAGLGFLWFNCHPATVFMGDVGSLALGGALGTVAILIRKELLLIIVGGLFVLEALSVIVQVVSFKLFKRRVFKIAPLHHHFQFLGWSENKVIVRFWILASLFTLLTLVTLKTR